MARGDSVVFAGVDWYTLTYKKELPVNTSEILTQLISNRLCQGYVYRPWKTAMAEGYSVGTVKWGKLRRAPDTGIVVVSGHLAQAMAVSVPPPVNVTRLDIALDVYYESPNGDVEVSLEGLHKKLRSANDNRRKTKWYSSMLGGWTFYYGSGGSGFLLRVYDKGAERGQDNQRWLRWELQIGRDYAGRAVEAMQSDDCALNWIRGTIVKFCSDRGILLPPGSDVPHAWIAATRVELGNDQLEKSKRYFTSVVAPFVRRLINETSEDYVLKELGVEREYVYGGEIKVPRLYDSEYLKIRSDNSAITKTE